MTGTMPPMIGNRTLVEHGILNEESDYRVHVCVDVRRIYVFPTKAGADAVRSGRYRERSVYDERVETARGFLVPPLEIADVDEIILPDDVVEMVGFSRSDSTPDKGRKAERAFSICMERGLVRLPVRQAPVRDRETQLRGLDVVVSMGWAIEVKCDYYGGPRELGGSGSLYLQTHECNPRRQFIE